MRIVHEQKEMSLSKVKKEFSIQILLIVLVVASCAMFMGMLALIRLF